MAATRNRTTALTANAVGMATALAFLSQEAEAAVEVFTPDPSPVGPNFFVSFDPVSNSASTSFGNPISFCSNGFSNQFGVFSSCGSGFEILFQSLTTSLNADSVFSTSDLGSGFNFITFPESQLAYVGYGFRTFGSTDAYNLGWVEVEASSNSISLYRWAYETEAGTSITVAVPESSTTALLAGGVALAGYVAYKRFKNNASE